MCARRQGTRVMTDGTPEGPADAIARQTAAIEMRRRGYAYVEVARSVGYNDAESARCEIQPAIARTNLSRAAQACEDAAMLADLRRALLREHCEPNRSVVACLNRIDRTLANYERRFGAHGAKASPEMTADGGD